MHLAEEIFIINWATLLAHVAEISYHKIVSFFHGSWVQICLTVALLCSLQEKGRKEHSVAKQSAHDKVFLF